MIKASELKNQMKENEKSMGLILGKEIKSALKYIESEIKRVAMKGKDNIEIWYANICKAVEDDLKIPYVKNSDIFFLLVISDLQSNGYTAREVKYPNRNYLYIKW